jgi:hypothetical protein
LVIPSGKDSIAGAVDFIFSDKLRKGLIDLTHEVAVEVSVDEQGLEYLDIIDELLLNTSGNIGYSSGDKNGLPISSIRFGYPSARIDQFREKLEAGSYKSESAEVYKLSTLKFKDGDFLNLYTIINGKDIWLINGKTSAKEAYDVMKGLNNGSEQRLEKSLFSAVFDFNNPKHKQQVTKLLLKVQSGLINLNFDIMAEVVANALPPGIIKKKKKRTKIKF